MHLLKLSVTLSSITRALADPSIPDISSHFCSSNFPNIKYGDLNSSCDPNLHLLSSHSKACHSSLKHHDSAHNHLITTSTPWTQEPLCTEPYKDEEPFCIYTSSTFANNRGISILTTPSIAASFSNHPAFGPSSHASHAAIAALSTQPFVQRSIPGKGLGLFATRILRPGDLIFAYTPATILHASIYKDMEEDGKLGRLEMQRETANRLPEDLRKKWWALLGHFGGDLADDIINTNAFEEKLGEMEEQHFLLLPETARINHDCRPNSQYFFEQETFTHFVHATTTIHQGDEITVSYTDPLVPRLKRRETIKQNWGFECSCSLCSQRESLTSASDDRLAQILAIEKLLDDWASPVSRREKGVTPLMAQYVVELYELERLYGPIAEAYYRTALAWSSVGNEWKARRWAEKGAAAARLNSGQFSAEVEDLEEIANDPKKHWSWEWMGKENDSAG